MNIWRVRVDQDTGEVLGEPEAITAGGPSSQSHLSVSSRGVAYAERSITTNIFQMPFDLDREEVLGPPTPVTVGSNNFLPGGASPDGQWIAIASNVGQRDIFVVKSDGSERRQITSDEYAEQQPAWSPDGEWLAFPYDRSGVWSIWGVRPDGSGLRQLTKQTDYNTHGPIWSPDGARLAFDTYERGDNTVILFDPFRDWDEQTPEELPLLGKDEDFNALSWSPDGARLVGTRRQEILRSGGIIVYDIEAKQYQQVLPFGRGPRWIDSQRTLFTDAGRGLILDVRTQQTREVEDVFAGRGTLSPRNNRIFFSLLEQESDIWMLTLEP